MADAGLFEFNFGDWLEANGLAVTDLIGDPSQPAADMRFTATVDLTALREGIAELVIHHGGKFAASADLATLIGG